MEEEGPFALIVMDGYEFTQEDFFRRSQQTECLVVINDFTAKPDFAHLVVMPGPTPKLNKEPAPGNSIVHRGLDYALLDPAYGEIGRRAISETVESIFVCFGRFDSKGGTLLTLQALSRLRKDGFCPHISIALGSGSPHLGQVRQAIQGLGENLELLVDTENTRQILLQCDLAIGAGGVGLLERAASGTPSLCITIAENQIHASKVIAEGGGTCWCGHIDMASPEMLANEVHSLAISTARRKAISQAGQNLVDGKGSCRVAGTIKVLLGLHIEP